MSIVTILVPSKDNPSMMYPLTGTVMWLKVGNVKYKFLIHDTVVIHYASGGKFGDFKYIPGDSKRDRAKEAILSVIETHGIDKVLKVINSAKVING